MHRPTLDDRDRALRTWAGQRTWLTVRITAMSFAFTAVIGALVLLVHQLAQHEAQVTAGIGSFTVDLTPLIAGGYELPLMIVAVVVWVAASSISRLLVHRQIRDYLRGLAPAEEERNPLAPAGDAEGDVGGEEGGSAIVERMLLEGYLNMVNSLARALGVTVVIALLVPRALLPGMAIVWIVVLAMGYHRFRIGQRACDDLQTSAKARRSLGDTKSHRDLVDAIYRRDRVLYRMPLGQGAVVAGSMLVLVFIPMWVLLPETSAGVALVMGLLLLQSLMESATSAGALGFRHVFWWRRQDIARAQADETPSAPIVSLLRQANLRWPATDVVWCTAGGTARTVLAFLGARGLVAGVRPQPLSRQLARRSIGLMTVRDHPFAAGAAGYAALGDTLDEGLAGLADLIDLNTCVVVGCDEGCVPARALVARFPTVRLVELVEDVVRPDEGAGQDARMGASLADVAETWFGEAVALPAEGAGPEATANHHAD